MSELSGCWREVRTHGEIVMGERYARVVTGVLLLAAVLAACTPTGAAPPGSPSASGAPPSTVVRTVTIALVFEPDVLEPSLLAVSREIAPVTSAFLTYMTPRQEAKPYLASELPSIENGSWKVFPDGRMETTYKLRSDAKWQDG